MKPSKYLSRRSTRCHSGMGATPVSLPWQCHAEDSLSQSRSSNADEPDESSQTPSACYGVSIRTIVGAGIPLGPL